jgi:hypothetical protein
LHQPEPIVVARRLTVVQLLRFAGGSKAKRHLFLELAFPQSLTSITTSLGVGVGVGESGSLALQNNRAKPRSHTREKGFLYRIVPSHPRAVRRLISILTNHTPSNDSPVIFRRPIVRHRRAFVGTYSGRLITLSRARRCFHRPANRIGFNISTSLCIA